MSETVERPFDGNLQILNYTPWKMGEELRMTCQEIGHEAWSAQLDRPRQEIDRLYGSAHGKAMLDNTIESLTNQNTRWRKNTIAQYGAGVLLLARLPDRSTSLGGQLIGYVIARNNLSGNVVQRLLKRHIMDRKPYAWIQSINVRPEYQGQGVGASLLYSALNHFDQDQRATAYVLDENERGLEWFKKMGFRRTSFGDLEPQSEFFGRATKPAYLHRFESEHEIWATTGSSCLSQLWMPEFVEVDAPQRTAAFL